MADTTSDTIVELLKKLLSGTSQGILSGSDLQSPPKQFTYTVAAGDIQTVFYAYDFLRILSLSSSTGVLLRFGDSGTPTDVIGAGIGYRLNTAVRQCDIINTSGAPITITISLAIGQIFDDRLNVSGTLNVANTASTGLFVINGGGTQGPSRGTIGTTATQITGTITNQRFFILKNLSTTDSIYVGTSGSLTTANGWEVKPGEALSVDWTNHVYLIAGVASVPYQFWGVRA